MGICEVLADYFGRQGFRVATALSAVQARELFSKRVPGLVILDLRMPGEDGLSLANWIRNAHRRPLTARNSTCSSKLVALALGAGAADDRATIRSRVFAARHWSCCSSEMRIRQARH